MKLEDYDYTFKIKKQLSKSLITSDVESKTILGDDINSTRKLSLPKDIKIESPKD